MNINNVAQKVGILISIFFITSSYMIGSAASRLPLLQPIIIDGSGDLAAMLRAQEQLNRQIAARAGLQNQQNYGTPQSETYGNIQYASIMGTLAAEEGNTVVAMPQAEESSCLKRCCMKSCKATGWAACCFGMGVLTMFILHWS